MPEFPVIDVFEFNDLLKGIKSGDQIAFETFYKKFAERIAHAAFAYVGKFGMIEDVVNDIMLKIKKLAKSENYVTNPGAWIITIVKNHCLNLIRKNQKIIYCADVYVNNDFEAAEAEMMFHDYLTGLDERERLVIIFKISFGYTFKEIAKELKISDSNAEKIFYRAKEKIIV